MQTKYIPRHKVCELFRVSDGELDKLLEADKILKGLGRTNGSAGEMKPAKPRRRRRRKRKTYGTAPVVLRLKPPMLTVAELAAATGLKKTKIRNIQSWKGIPGSVKYKGKLYFPEDAVSWLKNL